MTTTRLIRRLAVAFLLAVIGAALLTVVKHVEPEILDAFYDVVRAEPNDGACDSEDEGDVADCEAVMAGGGDFCSRLVPYGYWWFFWGCNLNMTYGVVWMPTPLVVIVPESGQ